MSSVEYDDRQFPLTVALTAMSDQTRAQIEYYIERSKNKKFSLANRQEDPDVVIIDYDHPGTPARLETDEWDTHSTMVILAAGNKHIDGAIMVAKPLDTAGLENAAIIALKKLNGYDLPTAGIQSATAEEPGTNILDNSDFFEEPKTGDSLPKLTRRADSRPDDSDTPSYFRTIDAALPGSSTMSIPLRIQRYQDKIDLLCGAPRSIEQLRDPFDTDHRYDPTQCLSRRVAQVVFNPDPEIKAVHIRLPEAEVYVLPTLNKIYTSVSLEYKRNVNRLFRDWNDVSMKVFEYGSSNVNEAIDTLNQSTRYSFSSQSFCWLSSLFSAQGRLPLGMDIDAPIRLLHWPNITRLELIPDSLEISAAWSGNVSTLPKIINRVRCEPRHAASFLNAADTIQLMVSANAHGH